MRANGVEQMNAKMQAETLYFRHGTHALDIVTCSIEAAITVENDTLAMELDHVLQEVERLTYTQKRDGWSVYEPDLQ